LFFLKEISAEAYGFITIDRTGDASPEELLNQEKKSELARKREKRKVSIYRMNVEGLFHRFKNSF